jgi:hypothetical protein
MAVRKGFLCNESIAAVVLEGVAECCRFSGTLRGVEIASGLDDLSQLLVCMR